MSFSEMLIALERMVYFTQISHTNTLQHYQDILCKMVILCFAKNFCHRFTYLCHDGQNVLEPAFERNLFQNTQIGYPNIAFNLNT